MNRDERLFGKYDFHSAIRNAPVTLVKAIDELPDQRLLGDDQQKLLDELVAGHMIHVPVLDVDAIQPSQREVNLDLAQDPRERFMRDLDRPHYVKATEISFRVPFKGDKDVFYCQPSSFSLSGGPRADVEHNSIVIRVVRQDQNAAEYRKVFDASIRDIQSSLDQLRSDCAGLEATLRQMAVAHLAKRREKRQKDSGLIDGLGFGKPKG